MKQFDSYRPTYEVEEPEKLTTTEIVGGFLALTLAIAVIIMALWLFA